MGRGAEIGRKAASVTLLAIGWWLAHGNLWATLRNGLAGEPAGIGTLALGLFLGSALLVGGIVLWERWRIVLAVVALLFAVRSFATVAGVWFLNPPATADAAEQLSATATASAILAPLGLLAAAALLVLDGRRAKRPAPALPSDPETRHDS